MQVRHLFRLIQKVDVNVSESCWIFIKRRGEICKIWKVVEKEKEEEEERVRYERLNKINK
jgi:hypothetical protein